MIIGQQKYETIRRVLRINLFTYHPATNLSITNASHGSLLNLANGKNQLYRPQRSLM